MVVEGLDPFDQLLVDDEALTGEVSQELRDIAGVEVREVRSLEFKRLEGRVFLRQGQQEKLTLRPRLQRRLESRRSGVEDHLVGISTDRHGDQTRVVTGRVVGRDHEVGSANAQRVELSDDGDLAGRPDAHVRPVVAHKRRARGVARSRVGHRVAVLLDLTVPRERPFEISFELVGVDRVNGHASRDRNGRVCHREAEHAFRHDIEDSHDTVQGPREVDPNRARPHLGSHHGGALGRDRELRGSGVVVVPAEVLDRVTEVLAHARTHFDELSELELGPTAQRDRRVVLVATGSFRRVVVVIVLAFAQGRIATIEVSPVADRANRLDLLVDVVALSSAHADLQVLLDLRCRAVEHLQKGDDSRIVDELRPDGGTILHGVLAQEGHREGSAHLRKEEHLGELISVVTEHPEEVAHGRLTDLHRGETKRFLGTTTGGAVDLHRDRPQLRVLLFEEVHTTHDLLSGETRTIDEQDVLELERETRRQLFSQTRPAQDPLAPGVEQEVGELGAEGVAEGPVLAGLLGPLGLERPAPEGEILVLLRGEAERVDVLRIVSGRRDHLDHGGQGVERLLGTGTEPARLTRSGRGHVDRRERVAVARVHAVAIITNNEAGAIFRLDPDLTGSPVTRVLDQLHHAVDPRLPAEDAVKEAGADARTDGGMSISHGSPPQEFLGVDPAHARRWES